MTYFVSVDGKAMDFFDDFEAAEMYFYYLKDMYENMNEETALAIYRVDETIEGEKEILIYEEIVY